MNSIANARIVGETLNEKAYKRLKQAIVRHEILPGTRVLESHLAATFGISRTPVREAVNQLISEGLIVNKSKGFNVVLEVTEKDINEIFDLRQLIELHMIDYVTSHYADFDEAPFKAILAEFDENMPEAATVFMKQDEAFHTALISMVNNDRMTKIYNDLSGQTKVFRHVQSFNRARVRSAMELHRVILAALKDGDYARAAAAMTQHLERARLEALSIFEG